MPIESDMPSPLPGSNVNLEDLRNRADGVLTKFMQPNNLTPEEVLAGTLTLNEFAHLDTATSKEPERLPGFLYNNYLVGIHAMLRSNGFDPVAHASLLKPLTKGLLKQEKRKQKINQSASPRRGA